MKKVCLFIVICNLCYSINTFATEKTKVFVSILPQKYFVEKVAGDLVEVSVMVGPGQNPATYEPTPKQMAQLAKAKLYFSIDVPFEKAWLSTIKKSNRDMIMVDCCVDRVTETNTAHHHDSHIWTSPIKVIELVEQIKEYLIRFDAANADTYRLNAKTFIEQLSKLNIEIKGKTERLNKRELIVSHPSWGFFAEEYGLIQIPIEQKGKEIQAKSLSKLIKEAKQKNIKAVFVQPQFNNKAAEMIAKELNAELILLDPLVYDYLANLEQVTEKIIKGLSNE